MIEFARTKDSLLWKRNFAGDTFNTAWYFRQLARDWQTAYFTAVGTDGASTDMLSFMEEAGIDTSSIVRFADRGPGLYTIDLNNGERSFSYWRETAAARLLARDKARLVAAFDGADEIYFSGITLAILSPDDRQTLIDCLGAARNAGVSVSFDPNIRPRLWADRDEMRVWIDRAAEISSRAFPTFPDEAELFADSEPAATAARYRHHGVEEVVVKNGEHPCFAEVANTSESVAAQQVDELVDTTGAGDSFNGGFLAARCSGATLAEACQQAHRLAARVVSEYGALLPKNALVDFRPA